MTQTSTKKENTSKSTAATAEDAVSRAKETVNTAYQTARDASSEVMEKAAATGQAALHDGTDLVASAHSELNSVVRRNPTMALAGALGIGILLGLAMKPRN